MPFLTACAQFCRATTADTDCLSTDPMSRYWNVVDGTNHRLSQNQPQTRSHTNWNERDLSRERVHLWFIFLNDITLKISSLQVLWCLCELCGSSGFNWLLMRLRLNFPVFYVSAIRTKCPAGRPLARAPGADCRDLHTAGTAWTAPGRDGTASPSMYSVIINPLVLTSMIDAQISS